MARGKLTPEEMAILKENQYVVSVTETQVRYSAEFQTMFVEEYRKGKAPMRIFEDAGFDIAILGSKRIERAAARWKEKAGIGVPNYKRQVTKEAEKRKKQRNDEKIAQIKEISQKKIDQKDIKIAELEAEVELLKKAGKLGRRRCEKKEFGKIDLCILIEEMLSKPENRASIKALCEAVGISRGTYYYYINHKQEREEREEKDLENLYFVQKAFDSTPYYKSGSRSIYDILKNDFDIVFNRKKIQRVMRKFNLVCPIKTRNPYKGIWKATEEDRVAPNIVNRHFKTGEVRKVLLTDITYIKHQDRFSYLSVILDAQTGEPIAHKLSTNMKMDFVLNTLKQLNPNEFAEGIMIHSDQGVHYTSKAFREEIEKLGITQSMSRRGNCHDNSPMESFFGHLKQEMPIDKSWDESTLEHEIDKYINYYRYHRYQRKLKGCTPYEYYNTLKAA